AIAATSPLIAAAPDASKSVALSIQAATASVPGYMSAAHYSLLSGATSVNTASALVQRDASGNIAFGTATGNLTGTATSANQLAGATLAQVRDFSQTTGVRDHTAISDFDGQVRLSRLDQ